MTDKEKIDALIENYKVISEESQSYLTEMLRCFPYAAIVLAIALGFGGLTDLTKGVKAEELVQYMPLALLGLIIYFFSLGFMYINATRYKAEIEKKINEIANDNLFGFELQYKPELLKTGFLPIGKKKKRILPIPNFFLGIMILGVYIYLVAESKHPILYISIGIIFGILALYVFLIIPRVIEEYQKNNNNS